ELVAGGILEGIFKFEVKNQLWYDKWRVMLHSSPIGYAAGIFLNPNFYKAVGLLQLAGQTTTLPAMFSKIPFLSTALSYVPILSTLTIPGSVVAVGSIIMAIQGGAILASNTARFFNWLSGFRKSGKRWAEGDAMVVVKERTGGGK
ncbi:MAG: hypothetical protein U0946_02300, partial [Patescibacteria group bacterium]|nr:hypothetical protein [Patescibacteria group bacterium]